MKIEIANNRNNDPNGFDYIDDDFFCAFKTKTIVLLKKNPSKAFFDESKVGNYLQQLNHEYIHAVIDKLEGEPTSLSLDYLRWNNPELDAENCPFL